MIGGTDATQLERDLARSTARRQVVVGIICLVLAVGLFAVSASGGSIVLVPTGLTAFAILELGRGIAGFGRLAAR